MSSIQLKLITNDSLQILEFKSSNTVLNLKQTISKFEDFEANRLNLLLVRTSENLDDCNSLDFYKILNGDEIFVTKPCTYSISYNQNQTHNAKVTEKDIEDATKDLELKNNGPLKINQRDANDSTLRSVLITLIEISQYILCLNKNASDLFQFVHQEINKNNRIELVTPDINHINKLQEMGFSREVAENALIKANNSLNTALNLVFSESENDNSRQNNSSNSTNTTNSNNLEIQWLRDNRNDLFIKPMSASVILKLYRDYNRKFFRPHVATRERLVDMGFEETEATEALRLNSNNETAAVDYLLSNSVVIPVSEEDLVGIRHDSEIMKKILSNSDIQQGLLNIYSLLAFLNIVDNPKNLSNWLSNPETKLVLQQITSSITDFEGST